MNFNSFTCTSREQSERLIALGLKNETADYRHWAYTKDSKGAPIPTVNQKWFTCIESSESTQVCGLMKTIFIPAWSLHRLIEMMPYDFTDNNNSYKLYVTCDGVGYNDKEDTYSLVGWWHMNTYDDIIYCIEWLIKEGRFNKEYLEA